MSEITGRIARRDFHFHVAHPFHFIATKTMMPEARQRIAEAQKKRWAKARKAKED